MKNSARSNLRFMDSFQKKKYRKGLQSRKAPQLAQAHPKPKASPTAAVVLHSKPKLAAEGSVE